MTTRTCRNTTGSVGSLPPTAGTAELAARAGVNHTADRTKLDRAGTLGAGEEYAARVGGVLAATASGAGNATRSTGGEPAPGPGAPDPCRL